MPSIRIRPAVALSALALVLAACSDGTGSDRDPMYGEVRAEYSGDRTGTFVAEGVTVRDSLLRKTSSVLWDDGTDYVLSSFRITGGLRGDRLLLLTSGTGPGTYTVEGCAPETAEGCLGYGALVFDMLPGDNGDTEREVYVFTEGGITVESVANGRARGTFRGTAVSSGAGASAGVLIRDGRFDVPVMDPTETPAARRP